MSTHNNDEHLLVYKYVRDYLDKLIKRHTAEAEINEHPERMVNDIKEEGIIDMLNHLEGK